jgi:hypothetical protein
MANTFPTKTVWSRIFQLSRYKVPVYSLLAKMDLVDELEFGASVKRTYSSDFATGKMSAAGGYNIRNRVNTEEQIDIDQKDFIASRFPSWEKLLWVMNNDQKFSQDSAARLHTQLDADGLNVVRAGAGQTLDDSVISAGGVAGNGITATIGNIIQIFSTAEELLNLANATYPSVVPYTGNVKLDLANDMKVAICDPHTINIIRQYQAGRNTPLGDTSVKNQGYVGYFMGFNVFSSNSLPFTATLAMPTQPTDGDTVVIGGVTFTFKTTLGSTAGNVLIGGSADAARANLTALINAPFTTTAQGVALTSTEIDVSTATGVAKALIFGDPADTTNAQVNISATNDNTADTMAIVVKGVNKITVSDTLTAADGIFTTTLQCVNNIFAVTKCYDLILKRDPSIDTNPVSNSVAKDFIFWDLYGRKVFRDQAVKIVNVKMQASTLTAPTQTF